MLQTHQPSKLSHITLWPLDLASKVYVIVQRRSTETLAGICAGIIDHRSVMVVHEIELRKQTVSVGHVLVVNLNNLPKMDANKLYTPPRLISFEVSLWFHIHD
jgi:hypothetical protein